jgi:acetyl-CoA C-acetyltransferase
MGVCIAGWAHTRFRRQDVQDLEPRFSGTVREALGHAGIAGDAVDSIWLGTLDGGVVPETFPASLVLQGDGALRWNPATRIESAGASGAAALYAARDAIGAAGRRSRCSSVPRR